MVFNFRFVFWLFYELKNFVFMNFFYGLDKDDGNNYCYWDNIV